MAENRIYQRTIKKESITSKYLGKTRHMMIYLPPGYNELIQYPVIYCQDGLEFFNFGRIATHANRLILEEGMEPVVIVGIEVDMPLRSTEYAPDGERFSSYCSFFNEEMLPYVEERYSVRREAEDRIIAGDSLGATVCMHLAVDRPDLYRRIIALSGAFFEATRNRLSQEADLSWLEIYMLVGLQEKDVNTQWGEVDFVTHNRETKQILQLKNVQLEYQEKDGTHTWGFWQNELPKAIRHFIR